MRQTSGIHLPSAYANRPVLFFLDEIDSIGTQRQQLGRNDDVGGAASLVEREGAGSVLRFTGQMSAPHQGAEWRGLTLYATGRSHSHIILTEARSSDR